MRIYRQGDVLIMSVSSKPSGDWVEAPLENGRVILAHGEVTGHAHGISARSARLFRKPNAASDDWRDDALLEIAAGGATLAHEEHAPISLSAGHYIVRRQREYSPEAIVTVAD